jgi:hypothetical protein
VTSPKWRHRLQLKDGPMSFLATTTRLLLRKRLKSRACLFLFLEHDIAGGSLPVSFCNPLRPSHAECLPKLLPAGGQCEASFSSVVLACGEQQGVISRSWTVERLKSRGLFQVPAVVLLLWAGRKPHETICSQSPLMLSFAESCDDWKERSQYSVKNGVWTLCSAESAAHM